MTIVSELATLNPIEHLWDKSEMETNKHEPGYNLIGIILCSFSGVSNIAHVGPMFTDLPKHTCLDFSSDLEDLD